MSLRHVLALAIAAALLLWNLGYAPYWNPDEGRYAAASLEMAQPFNGEAADWITPHLNTVPRLNKPPLVYWCAASLYKVIGVKTSSGRLVSALAAVGVLLIVWQLGIAMFGRRAGVLAALVWATSLLPFIFAHLLSTDMLLTLAVTMSLWGLWRICEKLPESGSDYFSWSGVLLAGVGMGLALLAKGPVGVVLPIGIWGLWLIVALRRRFFQVFRQPFVGGVLSALALMLVVGAPWYYAIWRVHPEFLTNFIFGENLARLSGSQFYHVGKPFWYYIPITLVGVSPWTAFLICAFGQGFKDFRSLKTIEVVASDSKVARENHIVFSSIFLWIWALAVIGLFSISHVKLITYILPAFPALSLLIAGTIYRITHQRHQSGEPAKVSKAVIATAVLLLLLGIILPIAFLSPKLLADTLVPRGYLSLSLVGIVCVSLVSGVALLGLARKNLIKVSALIALSSGVLLVIILNTASKVAYYEDPSPLVFIAKKNMSPNDKFVQFKVFQPTGIFYLERPNTIIDFINTSGLDEDSYQSSAYFPDEPDAIEQLLKSSQKVFVLVRWKNRHWPQLKDNTYLWAANNDYRLLSNKRPPEGFPVEFMAPKKRDRKLSPECRALSPTC